MDQKSKVKFDDEKAIRSTLLQFSIFLLFVLATTVVSLSSRHLYMFYFNDAIFSRLEVQERYATVVEWWRYLLSAVIPQLPTAKARNARDTNANDTKSERKLLDENLMLGWPRLRQMRVVSEPCVGPAMFTNGLRPCYPAYSRLNEDTSETFQGTRYYTKSELDATTIEGVVNDYEGGGYMESLSFSRIESVTIVFRLWRNSWVDRGTRVVLLEFTLYNERTELFNNVKLLAELLPTGGALMSGQVSVFKLYGLWTSGWGTLLLAVIFYVMVVYYTVLEVKEVKKIGFKLYIRHAWTIVDLIILSLGFCSFFYNLWHPIHLTNVLRHNENDPTKFQSLDTISYMEKLYLDGMAICTFLVWIKVLKFINFTKTTIQLRITFKKCYKDVLGFSVFFMCLIFAYAWWGFLHFGAKHQDFKTFGIALWSVMRMVLCDFDYEGVEKTKRVIGPIYFITFIMVVFFVVVNMFLAIICDTFQEAKDEVGHAPSLFAAFLRKLCNNLKDELDKLLVRAKLKRPQSDINRLQDSVLREIVGNREPTPPPPSPSTAQPQKERLPRSLIISQPPARRVRFFEGIRSKEDAEQLDRLEQHIGALEEILKQARGDLEYFESKSRAQPASPPSPSPPLTHAQPAADQPEPPTQPDRGARPKFKTQPLYVAKNRKPK